MVFGVQKYGIFLKQANFFFSFLFLTEEQKNKFL